MRITTKMDFHHGGGNMAAERSGAPPTFNPSTEADDTDDQSAMNGALPCRAGA